MRQIRGFLDFNSREKQKRDPANAGSRREKIESNQRSVTTAAIAAAVTTTPAATATTATAVFTTRATVATTATTAGWTFFTRTCYVDRQGATVEFLAVQGINGLLRFFGAAHGDERKSTGATRHAIHHQVGFHDRAAGGKSVLQVVFRGFEGEISDKQLRAHVMFLS